MSETGSGGIVDDAPEELHPRIRERRDEVLKEHSRQRRRRGLWLVVPLATALVGLAVAHTPLLDVDRVAVDVQVEGQPRTSAEEVEVAAGILAGQPLLTLDERGAERRVRALPWVDRADVVREWPGTVRVAVTEREPVAAVATGVEGEVAWVDDTGRVLQVGGHVADGLVTVVGVDQVPAPGERLPRAGRDAVAYAAEARERIPGTLATVSTDLEAVVAEGQPGGGAVVRFRNGEDVDQKIVALHTMLTRGDTTCLATVDLWVPDRPAVTRRPC